MQKMSLSITLILVCFYFSLINGQKAEFQELVSESSLSFGVNLISNLQQRAGAEENLIFSPINIYAVLALLHLGSSGATRDSLADTLGFPKDENQIPDVHEALGEILRRLQNKDLFYPLNREQHFGHSGLSYVGAGTECEVNIANGLFVKNDYPFLTSYIDQMQKYYDSAPTNVDFSNNPKHATDLINKWASNSTKTRIQQLYALPLSPLTEIVLAGTLYFKGKWKSNFQTCATKPETFDTGVKDIEVQMMRSIMYLPYFNNPKLQFQAIHLPYRGDEYIMAIILPYESQNLKNLIQNMNSDVLKKVFDDNLKNERVECKIPRMKFSWNNSLVETLSIQGMENIFQNADLRNMISANNFLISDLTHAAEIEVDEFGTVASAVTRSRFACGSSMNPPDPIPFFVNRPFLAAIYHKPTATILFMALVHQPILSNS